MAEAVGDIWHDVVTAQSTPDRAVVLAALVVVIVIVVVPRTWRIARYALTIAHEGSHALAALSTGRQLAGIRVHSDTSGLTVSRGRPTGPGMILTALAGYVGPALVGLGGAHLLSSGHALAVLWLAVVLLALILLQIRNFYGLYAVLVAGLAVFAISWWGRADWQAFAAYVGVWFLLVGSPRAVLELQLQRRRGRGQSSDADVLAKLTRLPGVVWVGFFLVVTLACLLLGARQLLA
ncbi:putative membrane protein [metagenome]|uniref:Putative membrane protein n=1 Tax=metagenome TaxID=256318 RepID=A0A2P2CDQ6_9ZZZZ